MKIGKLRHRVDVQTKGAATAGDRGQPVASWVNLYSDIYAGVEPLSGREAELARQLVPQASFKVTLRYHADITTQERIVFGSQILNIGYINNPEQRNLWLILLCEAEP